MTLEPNLDIWATFKIKHSPPHCSAPSCQGLGSNVQADEGFVPVPTLFAMQAKQTGNTAATAIGRRPRAL
jgi:hypothetical protein